MPVLGIPVLIHSTSRPLGPLTIGHEPQCKVVMFCAQIRHALAQDIRRDSEVRVEWSVRKGKEGGIVWSPRFGCGLRELVPDRFSTRSLRRRSMRQVTGSRTTEPGANARQGIREKQLAKGSPRLETLWRFQAERPLILIRSYIYRRDLAQLRFLLLG